MVADYEAGISGLEIAKGLSNEVNGIVPERSVIAKLSSLGVYKRKKYTNKQGDIPIRKEEYIERIAKLLDINIDLMESLEKVTKTALVLMEKQISALKGE
jgi:CMP-2-keto-3-deoxyoctulosonic acid synthetase